MRALIMPYNGTSPSFGKDVFLAPNCSIIGAVELGDRVSVWYGAVLRGDVHKISIGADSNIQDAVVMHGTWKKWPVILGERVSVGHSAVIHGSVIEDDVLVGIGATMLDGSHIGRYSLIAAAPLVREGSSIPPRALVVGVPGPVKRALSDNELERITTTPEYYFGYAADSRAACLAAGLPDPVQT